MCLRKYFCKWFCKPDLPDDMPEPAYLEEVDLSRLIGELNSLSAGTPVYLTDRQYKTTSVIELQRYLKYDLTDKQQYVHEYYDCDDYSFSLLGSINNPAWGMLPFGVIWVVRDNQPPHACNIFVDDNYKIWCVEPQNDEVFDLPDDWKPYLIMI